jgi:GNAT superfamily N-acetyltransferase
MSTTEGLEIRDATPGDAGAIARTHNACWQEAYVGQLPEGFLSSLSDTFDPRRAFWKGVAESPGPQEALLVAEAAGGLVGFVHVCARRDPLTEERTGEVTAIYLRKSHWGHGIGRQLLAEATNRLQAFGFEDATLWVLDTNVRARGFYETTGWVADGSEKCDQRGDLMLREVRYRKRL